MLGMDTVTCNEIKEKVAEGLNMFGVPIYKATTKVTKALQKTTPHLRISSGQFTGVNIYIQIRIIASYSVVSNNWHQSSNAKNSYPIPFSC